MLVRFNFIKFVVGFQVFKHFVGNRVAVFAAHKAEAVKINAHVVNRHNFCKTQSFTEFKVFDTAAGRDVYDAGTFVRRDIFPRYDFMINPRLRRNIREAGFVMIADKFRAFERAQNFLFVVAEVGNGVFRQNQRLFIALDADFDIVNIRIDRQRNVGRKRPGRCGPNQDFAVDFFKR